MRPLKWHLAGFAGMIGVLSALSPAPAAESPLITKPVQVTSADTDPLKTYGSPSLAIDPEDSRNIAAGFINIRAKRCGLLRSTDSGGTWTQLDASPAMQSYPFCFSNTSKATQTSVAFGRNHRLYYLLSGWDDADGGLRLGNVSLLLGRSDDLGEHWTTTFVRDARGIQGNDVESNRPFTALVVDTKSAKEDIVYATWRQDRNSSQPPRPAQPMVAVSTDSGKTFAAPVSAVGGAFEDAGLRQQAIQATTTTLAPATPPAPPAVAPPPPDTVANFGGGNPSLTVDGKGTVYVVWPSWTVNIAPRPEPGIFVSRSTDRGKTFTVSQIAPFKRGNPGDHTYKIVWSAKGGPDGTLHLVHEWRDPAIASHVDVLYRRSTDGGRTWTEPRDLADDDPKEYYGRFIPNITVAPNGRLDVVWWDTRTDPGIRGADVFHTSSADKGTTWSKNTRISDRLVDRRFGVFGANFDISAPPGLASTDAFVITGWDDTRHSPPLAPGETFGQGTQDIYTAAVQYQELGGGTSPATKVVLAACGGLIVAGLIFLILAFRTRRPVAGQQPGERGSLADETPIVTV